MKKKLGILLTLLLSISLLVGCGGNPASGGSAASASAGGADSRTLRLSANAAYSTLDPYATNALINFEIWNQTYEGLIFYDYDKGAAEPRIAKTWEMSDDGLTWTFHLRDDVKFHNGETLKASDVVFSYNRASKAGLMATYLTGISSVTAPDDTTVEFKLSSPVAPFLQNIASLFILNEKFVTEKNDDLTSSICGTGPYMLSSADLNTKIELTAFDGYYRGAPSIKTVTWDVITDATSQSMALEAGDLDLLNLAFSQYSTYAANDKFTTAKVPTYHTVWVTFNCSKAPFNNVKLRQAIAYLLNRDEIVQATFEGLGDADSLLISPNIQGLPDKSALKQYTCDPDKGLALLKEAGYDTSKEIDLGVMRTYPENHYITKACPIIQAQLAKYNIKLSIEPMEVNAFVQAIYGGDFTIAMSGGSYGADASMYNQIFNSSNIGVTGGNCFQWSNSEVDALFEQGAREMDAAKRQEIYGKIMDILYNEVPGTGVGHKYNVYAWTKDLNATVTPRGFFIYDWSFAQ